METGYGYRNVLPFTAMVTVECTNVAVMTMYKAATRKGMSYHVFIAYSYAIAALLLLPFPFCDNTNRSRVLPRLSFPIITKLGLLGVIGFMSVMTGYIGINYSSPTLASAISSLFPAITFVVALVFRMETLELRSSNSSWAKVLGTIVSVAGAFVVTLYKGPTIKSTPSSVSISLAYPETSWAIGGLFLTTEFVLSALWYIVLAQIMKVYPAELTVMFYYNSTVVILAAVVGFFMEPDPNAWRIRPDIGLLTILCAGIGCSFLRNIVCTWALYLKGPLFVSMFKPLSIVIAVGMGVLFLGDALYLGSVIGATIISIGFYTVMWGKAKEEMGRDNSSSMPKTPLLQSYRNGDEREEQIIGIA